MFCYLCDTSLKLKSIFVDQFMLKLVINMALVFLGDCENMKKNKFVYGCTIFSQPLSIGYRLGQRVTIISVCFFVCLPLSPHLPPALYF